MESHFIGPLTMHAHVERWPLREPFVIAGHTLITAEVLVVALRNGEHTGWGEAVGVWQSGETPVSMTRQLDGARFSIESGIDRTSLLQVLPPGGARCAVDCALWDLEAKASGRPAWQIAGLESPRSLLTTFTCSADDPERMAARALTYASARAIKIKLIGELIDSARIVAVRNARPDVWLSVDANQGMTPRLFEHLLPVLVDSRVSLIEQPFPIGKDSVLANLSSPIPIMADESVQTASDIPDLVDRYHAVNIKVHKCGGLTEAFAMARVARSLGLSTMIGNAGGTSLAMAPAFLVGQVCTFADLDGPTFLASDRAVTVEYADGYVRCPEPLWGGP